MFFLKMANGEIKMFFIDLSFSKRSFAQNIVLVFENVSNCIKISKINTFSEKCVCSLVVLSFVTNVRVVKYLHRFM